VVVPTIRSSFAATQLAGPSRRRHAVTVSLCASSPQQLADRTTLASLPSMGTPVGGGVRERSSLRGVLSPRGGVTVGGAGNPNHTGLKVPRPQAQAALRRLTTRGEDTLGAAHFHPSWCPRPGMATIMKNLTCTYGGTSPFTSGGIYAD